MRDRHFVHALGERDEPACAAFDERDPRTRIAIEDAARDQVHRAVLRIVHLVGVVDDPRAGAALDDDRLEPRAGVHHKDNAELRRLGKHRIPRLVIIFG